MIKIAYELISSILTLSGQFAGSTTQLGAIIYVAAGAAWAGWMCIWRQWGFIPINVAGTFIGLWNLWCAFN